MTARHPLPRLLICDDDPAFHLSVKGALRAQADCRSAYNSEEAFVILKAQPFDALLLDIAMRDPEEGLRAIPRLRELDSDLAIVMISSSTDFATVREAMRLGAADYVPKTFDPGDLAHTVGLVLERRRLLRSRERQNAELVSVQRRHPMVGESHAMAEVRRLVGKFSRGSANVLITGETGTGKEVVARQLRGQGPDGALLPFVAVDASTIQGTMAESMLFGHEKGAFTGADRQAKGVFEEADGGIVYFDEIGNMPLEIQAKLLRVLQEKEVLRVGSTRPIPLEFRVVCATNSDLEERVRAGSFKDDLLQRLNVLPVHIPPLRDRREDIPALVEHFIARRAGGSGPKRVAADAMRALEAYSWPGNVRELGTVIAYVTTLADGPEVELADLPPKVRDSGRPVPAAAADASGGAGSFYERVAAFEKAVLAREYASVNGNVSKLALALGMDRSHLYTKLREFGLHAAKQRDSQD